MASFQNLNTPIPYAPSGVNPTGKKDLSQYYATEDVLADLTGVKQKNVMPNVREGLQLGMGINAPALDVATPCSFTPAVIIVTSVPAMYMEDGSKPTVMAQLTKDLMESHAKSVSGLDFGYTLGVDTSANVGMDSQMFGVPGKTTRNQPSPSFTFTELSGNLVFNWAKKWIWDINHPDTNVSMAQARFPGAYTMSAYAASFMVIQFDPTMRPDRIIDAAHYVNVFPTGTGDIAFERTIGTVKVPERSIPFHAIVQHNPYIKSLAIAMATKLQLHVHNYDVAPPNVFGVDPALVSLGTDGEMRDRDKWMQSFASNVDGAAVSPYTSTWNHGQGDMFATAQSDNKPGTHSGNA